MLSRTLSVFCPISTFGNFDAAVVDLFLAEALRGMLVITVGNFRRLYPLVRTVVHYRGSLPLVISVGNNRWSYPCMTVGRNRWSLPWITTVGHFRRQ